MKIFNTTAIRHKAKKRKSTKSVKKFRKNLYKNRKRLFVIGLFLIAIIFTSAFLLINQNSAPRKAVTTAQSTDDPARELVSENLYQALPDCFGNDIISQLPMNWSKLSLFSPMGQVSPLDGQVLPNSVASYIVAGNTASILNVVSPLDGYITKVHVISNGPIGNVFDDVTLNIMACKQVAFSIGYLNNLVPALVKVYLNSSTKTCQSSAKTSTTITKDCEYLVNYPIKSGDNLGSIKITSQQRGFSFGATDSRTQPIKFINPSRYALIGSHGLDNFHSVCPFGYMPSALQTIVYGRANLVGLPANSKCGLINQDKSGTIEGNWFADSSTKSVDASAFDQISIIHYANDPQIAEISVGGKISSPGVIAFRPSSNPQYIDPANTSIGPIYCYGSTASTDGQSTASYSNGHYLLVQLISVNKLKIEYKTGSCSLQNNFDKATIYYR